MSAQERVENECRHIAEGGTSLYPTEAEFAEEVLAELARLVAENERMEKLIRDVKLWPLSGDPIPPQDLQRASALARERGWDKLPGTADPLRKAMAERDEALQREQGLRKAATSLRRYLADHGYVNEFKATGIPFIAVLDAALAAEPAAAPEECPSCGGDAGNNWFDRSLCPEPCGMMHTRCADCGRALDGCQYEAALPAVSLVVPQPGSEEQG